MHKKMPLLMAIAASLAAVILAVGFTASGSYDPALAVLTATLVAVIWYTYFTYQLITEPRRLEEHRRAQATAALATAALAELKFLDSRLRQVVANGARSLTDPLPHPVLSAVLARLDTLPTAAGEALASVISQIRDVQQEMAALRENRTPPGIPPLVFEAYVQLKARFAANALPELVHQLMAAGGQMPQIPQAEPADIQNLPPLVESPFGDQYLP